MTKKTDLLGDLALLQPTPEQEAQWKREHEEAMQKQADESRKVTMFDWLRAAPEWLNRTVRRMQPWRGIHWERGNSDAEDFGPDGFTDGRSVAPGLPQAEVLGSRLVGHHYHDYRAHHVLALDIDMPVALIPSSTEGHHHLIIESVIPDEQWRALIKALADARIIEQSYAEASLSRGETFIRAPWIRKGMEKQDVRAAFDAWLDAGDDVPETDVPGAPF